ncbi:UNVERIFIED_CONTAM: Pentatricopeptide repeat-containing protein, mitochondrial [Sesamum radiatum]|uniref:Pentatricopeptide repeat-containing protein, mitochondrial n=1 Tax=Sesamum radiatum TaxID=300843 RepID=A0AAW2M3S4_SESRA
MWRPLARRALLNRGTAAQKLLPPLFNLQVPNPETVALLPICRSASRLSFFSAKSHVCGSLRFFSSNPAEKYEDPVSEPPISEANEITGDFDFSAVNMVDGTTKPEFENEDSIFDDAMENLQANKGVGENFEGSVSLDENLDYVAAEDESLGEVKKNDPEKVESLLSLLQSSGTDTGSLESNMEGMDLVLDEEFVLKVLETPYIPGENLISFFRWILKNPEFKVTTRVVYALVTAICMGNRRREAYALWDLINEVGEKEKGCQHRLFK